MGLLLILLSALAFLGTLLQRPWIPVAIGVVTVLTSLFSFSLGLGGLLAGFLMILIGLADFGFSRPSKNRLPHEDSI
jgi:hypothetical protein